MSHTVLLYGATGFSGRLIAAEGQQAGMASQDGTPEHRMVLGGRDGNSLKKLADKHKMQYRTFSLDDRDDVRRGLRGVDVLINAAGPFAWTADRLIKGALDEGCHYVDINGEVDVYKKLDDFGRYAAQRGRAIVCSAGHTAAASDLLLDAALDHLNYGADLDCGAELGAVRIAMSRVMNLSHGSAETLWRSLREQVTVVRTLEVEDEQGNVTREPTLWHEPVGKLERTFDFLGSRPRQQNGRDGLAHRVGRESRRHLTARLTVARRKFSAKRIESYVEAGTVARIGYQLGTLLASVAAIPWVRFLAGQQIGLLPSGPTKQELRDDKQIVLLEIEDPLRTKIIDWRWETPNASQFTAQVVVEIARETLKGAAVGWLTPGAVLRPRKDQLTGKGGALRDCRLDDRSVLNPRTA
jgi:short subunit dehydrogenase-like uncharacterized protein